MTTRKFLIIGMCAFLTALGVNFATREIHRSGGIGGHTITPVSKIPALSRSLRPIYPYSVIPGGAYSQPELGSSVERDRLVREHYADFNVKAARLVMLKDDRYQYVSFRLKNQIFWTRKRLRIPKGEILLTDGYNYARTRCGNRLSSRPMPNIAPIEPSARLLSLPPYTPQLISQLPFAVPPVVALPDGFSTLPLESRLLPALPVGQIAAAPIAMVGNWPALQTYPPIFPIPVGYIPNLQTSPQIPVAPISPATPLPPATPPIISHVPEPASISLFGLASCVFLIMSVRAIRRHRENEAESDADLRG